MLLVYLLITIATILYGTYYYVLKSLKYWKERGVVSAKPLAFFGNLKESILRRAHISIVLKKIYDEFPNEKVVGVYRTITPSLLIRNLDVIKHVLIKDFDLFIDRGLEFSKEGLGANLFHADGEIWRVLRNQFTPLFTSGKLKNMLYLMVERGDKFTDYVQNLVREETEQEVHSLVQKFTISTISACAFGLDLDMDSDKMEDLKKIDNLIFTFTYVNELDMLYPGILKKLNFSLFPAEVNKFFHDLVKNVISQRNGKSSQRKDFMDLLLQLRGEGQLIGKKFEDNKQLMVNLTDGVIAAQAFVFFVAGYETSATTMAFMLYQLAQNPDIQTKLISEIDEVLEKHNNQVTYDVLQELTYLNKVFDETLRMYPLVDPLQRSAQTDFEIPGTGVQIKKGQLVLIPVNAIHHDKNYYPDPEKFDPERFSIENTKNRHPCAYLPFGLGPRNCIGMRFAQIQSRVCMVKLLSKYRVESTVKTPKIINFDPKRILCCPNGGIYLNIKVRK